MVTPVQMALKTSASGKFYAQGFGSDQVNEAIQITYQTFINISSVFLTTQNAECINRVQKNVSDYASTVVSYASSNDMYRIPVPLFTHKTAIFTGYNASDASIFLRESVTALSNFQELFRRSIFIISLLMLSTLLCFVTMKSALVFSLVFSDTRLGRSAGRALKRKMQLKFTWKSVHDTLSMKSRHFRWIAFLVSILLFFLITAFTLLFQTSQVINDTPRPIDSYKALLAHASAVPAFFNSMARVSSDFEDAKEGSIRAAVWSRLINSNVSLVSHVYDGFALDVNFPNLLKNLIGEMSAKRYVIIVSTMTLGLLKSFFCSLSPENELWRLLEFYDACEGETLMGYPVTVAYDHIVSKRLRYAFDTHVAQMFYKRLYDIREVGHSLRPTSRKHQHEQDLLCEADFHHDNSVIVSSLAYDFYNIFNRILLSIIGAAFICLICENIFFALNRRLMCAKPSRRQRCKMLFSRMIHDTSAV